MLSCSICNNVKISEFYGSTCMYCKETEVGISLIIFPLGCKKFIRMLSGSNLSRLCKNQQHLCKYLISFTTNSNVTTNCIYLHEWPIKQGHRKRMASKSYNFVHVVTHILYTCVFCAFQHSSTNSLLKGKGRMKLCLM